MKAPRFAYVKANSLQQVLDLLSEKGDDARILAGGQSLMATLNMRLSSPEVLIDINGLDELSGISSGRRRLRIGALTRHVEVLNSSAVRDSAPLISEAMPHIAHVAVRNRGTIGGSISLADPAAELPAVMVTLKATFDLLSKKGKRTVAASDFFKGLYDTELRSDELLTNINVPASSSNEVFRFKEISRRKGDFAIVGLAASASIKKGLLSSKKTLTNFRLVFFGCEDHPTLAINAAQSIEDSELSPSDISSARAALPDDLNPMGSLEGRADTKMHLAQVLLESVLKSLAERAQIDAGATRAQFQASYAGESH